jgi:hypothetical protein
MPVAPPSTLTHKRRTQRGNYEWLASPPFLLIPCIISRRCSKAMNRAIKPHETVIQALARAEAQGQAPTLRPSMWR